MYKEISRHNKHNHNNHNNHNNHRRRRRHSTLTYLMTPFLMERHEINEKEKLNGS